jgi:hypothetical protein
MPKLLSAKCTKKLPIGARLIKKALPEKSCRKGYFVAGGAPVVKLTRGSAKGCVRAARLGENKRIRQANRGEIKRVKAKSSTKKSSTKKSSVKKSPTKKSSTKKSSVKKSSPKSAKKCVRSSKGGKTHTHAHTHKKSATSKK